MLEHTSICCARSDLLTSEFFCPCSIASVLVSRFILNLREVDQSGPRNASLDDSLPSFVHSQKQEDTLRFASRSFADEFSAPLDHGFAPEDDSSIVTEEVHDSETDREVLGLEETVMMSQTSCTGLTLVSMQGTVSSAPVSPSEACCSITAVERNF